MKRARHDEPEDAVDGEGGESVRIDMTSVSAMMYLAERRAERDQNQHFCKFSDNRLAGKGTSPSAMSD